MKTHYLLVLAATLGFGIMSPTLSKADSPTPKVQKPVTDANIVGHVLDKITGEHIPGISISIKGTSYATTTDRSGHFYLRHLKLGTVTVRMQGVGFLSQERVITIEKGKTIEVNFYAEEDVMNLDELVVSSNRQATLRKYAPTLVSVIDDKIFNVTNAVNLAQGLTFQPGIRVENNCQNCGFNQVRINGLDGRFSQILIDSRAVFSSLAGVYGLEQLPANMIDRVEVVRGGGSALYGSSAIAGVINIITKDPTQNSFSYHQNITMTGGKKADNTLGFNASVIGADSRIGAMIFGQTRNRNEWDANNDGFSEIGKISSRALGTRTYFRLTGQDRITAEVHAIQEFRRGGDRLDLPVQAASVAESTNHNIYSGNIKYDHFSENTKHHLQVYASGQLVDRDSYYGGVGDAALKNLGTKDQEFGINFGDTKGRTYLAGVQYSYDFDHLLLMPAQILLGAEYNYDSLYDIMPLRQFEKVEGKDELLFPPIDQKIHVWSQMGQIEWKNDMFTFLLGARLDENSVVKTKSGGIKPILSPRATLRYNPNEMFNFRATYAKGFRAPQVFDEDLHVGVVNGEAQRVNNAEDLNPEYSHSFSLSSDMYFRIGEAKANLLVEGFYTKLVGAFNNEEIDNQHGITFFKRVNGSDANVRGINLEAKVAWRNLSVQGGLTLAKSQWETEQEWGNRSLEKDETEENFKDIDTNINNGPEALEGFNQNENGEYIQIGLNTKEFLRTPNVYGYFTIGYNPVKTLNISLTGNYTGQMYVPHAIEVGRAAATTDIALIRENKRPDTRSEESAPRWDRLEKTKSFFDLGARVSYDFSIFALANLQLYIGVNNILNAFQCDFDVFGFRDSGYIYGPALPRSYYAGIKLNI
ncbi:TonB-dependent receptor [Porphyromonas sp.]|uniref:TonB-dependent receptor n=1 Tax=Porphyromonas sp. TaxID=1924944 RepID=UPI0026DDA87C|nr:TonB-dependent receptor [Porphyromonas sp.]MDO4695642.1 TonB-dependent receptor [Porphyromonas sp.]MDO4771629.1 TonB-dependent receptor [Porphyromonas sp.]